MSYELLIRDGDDEKLRSNLLNAAAANPGIDVAIQREGLGRRAKRLVVLDVDSTLIQDEVIDLLAAEAGCLEEVQKITQDAMEGGIDFESSLRMRVRLLGRTRRERDRACLGQPHLHAGRPHLRPHPAAPRLHGRDREWRLHRLHRPARRRPRGAPRPRQRARDRRRPADRRARSARSSTASARPSCCVEIAAAGHVPLSQTVAVGDGANDLDMLSAAGLGIAFNAKPVVEQVADTALDVPYLDAILFVLGIRREDVEAADDLDGIASTPGLIGLSPSGTTVPGVNDQTLTVSELGTVVRAALEAAMPYGVWVEGEISGINRSRNGHVYFDLIEPSDTPGAAPVATVPVVLFRDNRDRVNRLLKRHGDPIRMSDGVQIRIQGVVDYYPPQGRIQFRMSAIDPTYTLGRLAAERDALMAALAADGPPRANARHAVPPVPMRVGCGHLGRQRGPRRHHHGVRAERARLHARRGRHRRCRARAPNTAWPPAIIAAAAAAGRSRHRRPRRRLQDRPRDVRPRGRRPCHRRRRRCPVITGVGTTSTAASPTRSPTPRPPPPPPRRSSWSPAWPSGSAASPSANADVVSGGRRAIERADHRVELARRGVIAREPRARPSGPTSDSPTTRTGCRARPAAPTSGPGRNSISPSPASTSPGATRCAGPRTASKSSRPGSGRSTRPSPSPAVGRSPGPTTGRVVRSVGDLAPGATITTRVADGTATSTIDDIEHSDLEPDVEQTA